MKFFKNSEPVVATLAKAIALNATDASGGDREETLAVWSRIGTDEDAREWIADLTSGELEIVVGA